MWDPEVPTWETGGEGAPHVQGPAVLGEESLRVRRPVPLPLFVRLMRAVSSKARRGAILRNTGYAVLARY
jgi:hypothetical protein